LLSIKVSIDIKGVKAAVNHIKRINAKAERELAQASKATALTVITDAQKLVPIDEGTLKNSITILSQSSLTIDVGTDLIYAHFIEFGTPIGGTTPNRRTKNPGPRPYLRPAAEMNRKKHEQRMARAVNKKVFFI